MGMQDNLEIERRSRQLWLDGMKSIIMAREGMEDFILHPEGGNPEQYKGDLHYIFRGRKIYVDLKMEVKVYPRLTLFYETMSNANEGRENPGWGRRIAYDSVWYAFEPAQAMVAVNMRAWHEVAEAGLKSGVLRELDQKKYKQPNLAKGAPCPLPWLIQRCKERRASGKSGIIRGIFRVGGEGVVEMHPEKDMPAFLETLRKCVGKT